MAQQKSAPQPTGVKGSRRPGRRSSEAADELIAGMKAGTIMNRSRPRLQAVRGPRLRGALRLHIRPEIGALKLSQVDRERVKPTAAQVDRGRADGVHRPQQP